jgi:hypothetical protein
VPGPTQTGEQPRRWRYSQGDLSSAVGQLRRPPPGAAMGRPRSHLGQRSPTGGDPHSPAQLTPSADSGRFSRCRLTVGLRQPLRVTRSRPAAPTTETHSTNGETHRRPSCERPGPVSPGSFASTGMRGHSRRTPRR